MKTSYIDSAGDPHAWSQVLLKTTVAILFTLFAASVQAAIRYVDNAATGGAWYFLG